MVCIEVVLTVKNMYNLLIFSNLENQKTYDIKNSDHFSFLYITPIHNEVMPIVPREDGTLILPVPVIPVRAVFYTDP